MNSKLPRIYSLKEVMKITGRSKSSIQRDIASGRLKPPLKSGPLSRCWLESDLEIWIANMQKERNRNSRKKTAKQKETYQ